MSDVGASVRVYDSRLFRERHKMLRGRFYNAFLPFYVFSVHSVRRQFWIFLQSFRIYFLAFSNLSMRDSIGGWVE